MGVGSRLPSTRYPTLPPLGLINSICLQGRGRPACAGWDHGIPASGPQADFGHRRIASPQGSVQFRQERCRPRDLPQPETTASPLAGWQSLRQPTGHSLDRQLFTQDLREDNILRGPRCEAIGPEFHTASPGPLPVMHSATPESMVSGGVPARLKGMIGRPSRYSFVAAQAKSFLSSANRSA
jgi:hypothetical protein